MSTTQHTTQHPRHDATAHSLLDYRYSILFLSIMLLVVVLPWLAPQQNLVTPIVFLVLMIGVLGTIQVDKRMFRIALILGVITFVLHYLALARERAGDDRSTVLVAVALAGYASFLLVAIRALIGRIFAEEVITFGTIKGGVAVTS